jgi:F-type H+-transporting ATPase subunit b
MLDMHLSLAVATLVVFLLLLVILNKILYKPLLSFMDSRDELIRKDLENAAKNSDETGVYFEEADKILSSAKHKAAEERAKLMADAKEEGEKRLSARRASLDKEYGEFLKALDKERKELKNALTAQMPLFKEALKAKLSKI